MTRGYTITNVRPIPYPEPSPTLQKMMADILEAKAQIADIMGVKDLGQDKPTTLDASSILRIMNAERDQKLRPPQIYTDLNATTPAEDWSKVRSPGRAARRRHKHRQNIRIYRKPAAYMLEGRLYVHPEILRALREYRL